MMNKILKSKNIIRFYLVLIAVIVIMKICNISYISDVLVLGLFAYVSVLIKLYNEKRNKQNESTDIN